MRGGIGERFGVNKEVSVPAQGLSSGRGESAAALGQAGVKQPALPGEGNS